MADPTITIQGLIDGSQPILGTSFPLTKGEKEGLDYMDVFDQINGHLQAAMRDFKEVLLDESDPRLQPLRDWIDAQ